MYNKQQFVNVRIYSLSLSLDDSNMDFSIPLWRFDGRTKLKLNVQFDKFPKNILDDFDDD